MTVSRRNNSAVNYTKVNRKRYVFFNNESGHFIHTYCVLICNKMVSLFQFLWFIIIRQAGKLILLLNFSYETINRKQNCASFINDNVFMLCMYNYCRELLFYNYY